VHLLGGMKYEIRQNFGVIIQFFVCGSEFRARWQNEIKDSFRAGKFLSKCRFLQNCRLSGYNALQAKCVYWQKNILLL
jgi:hypothetical protein